MSLQFIYEFQAKLYEFLSKNYEIKKVASGVYLSIQQDAKYPFILVNILKTNDISKYGIVTYEVDFEICIFVREKAQELLLKMASYITDNLKSEFLYGKEYDVLSMKYIDIEFVLGHDLLTSKALISYKALLQGKARRE